MLPGETSRERNLRIFDVEQPVAFITGSASPRVGWRIADYFLHEHFRVVFHGHHAPSLEASEVTAADKTFNRGLLLTGAVEEEAQVERWVAQILETHGRVDVLVNSAAIWDPIPLEHTRRADFESFFRVNALGTALCCQHFGLAMARQSSGGAIVNIGDWAVTRPYRDFAAYFLSKGSIVTITQSMAIELADRNPRVRVNAVLPGPVKMASGVSEQRRAQIVKECLLQREGTADDVAHAVLFLVTSPFISGVCVPVDGGRSIYAGPSTDPIAHKRCQVPLSSINDNGT